ncbi:MAG: hypothetical protein KBF17_15455 [Candidatus Promineofilum sp.]|nr:hypothetical protein [Promineifilum sp.]MBP9657902.1 hypothetical protein [Promineifilum sp.]
MSENMQKANEYVRQLRMQREAYQDFADKRIIPLFQDNDQHLERRPPRHFVDSSFLYVRSFNGDDGNRPFSNQVYWLSPDILISPVSNPGVYTRTLNAGEMYNLQCYVHNRGDMVAPSIKVEFWLTDPSLGFDTRYATHLTLGRVPTIWVNPYSSGVAQVTYTVPPTESGHKCLFARLFSFSPVDLPIDDFRLEPPLDRHIGQSNLHIVPQAQPFMFNVIHPPNAELIIQFDSMGFEELLSLNYPVMGDVMPFRDIPTGGWTERTGVDLSDTDAQVIDFGRENNQLFLATHDPEEIDWAAQVEIRQMIKRVQAEIDAGLTRRADHRDLFAKYREINGRTRRSTFKMHTPDIGLAPNQAIGLHIRSFDHGNPEEAEVLGGITLLIVGE